MKILVIGGTGMVGSQVVEDLVQRGEDVRVMTRSREKASALPSGVEGVVGDLSDPATLHLPFEGAEAMFFLIPVSPNETELGLAAVDAAQEFGLRRMVYMSVAMPPGSEHIPHFASKIPIEDAVIESGLEYAILRPTNFYQNDVWLKDPIVTYGVYPQPIGNLGINRVDVRDIADAAVSALLEPGHNDKTYDIYGPDTLTGDMTAEIYSRHLGSEVRYGGDDLDAWAKQAAAMMPDWMIDDFRIMYEYFQQHGFSAGGADLAEVLHHEPRPFDAFAAELSETWKGMRVR